MTGRGMKRVLLCLSHAVEEYQQLDLLHSLGYEVASIGGYIDPAHPHADIRPALPDVPMVPAVKEAVDALGTPDNLTAAQEHIPPAILDWLGDDGIIIYHHRLERLFGQWPHIRKWMRRGGRVIWRSVGQSVASNELEAQPFRATGLERIAYSPREAFIPHYAGHDAVIRFWGEQDDEPWTGEDRVVIQVSQKLRQRHPYTNWEYWDSATRGLPRLPLGEGSEAIGGPGKLPWPEIREALHRSRAFLWTGSQPASYTLGLIEAMHAGIPTVSIGPAWMRIQYGDGRDGGVTHNASQMFEGHQLAVLAHDDPNEAHQTLRRLLNDDDAAKAISALTRARARELFDRETVGAQWKAYLG